MVERERGFTLLEVLVAFTITALVIGAAYAAIASGTRVTARAGTAMEALARAEGALARVGTQWPIVAGERREQDGDWTTTIAIRPPDGDRAAWTRLGQGPWRVHVTVEGAGTPVVLSTLRLGTLPQ